MLPELLLEEEPLLYPLLLWLELPEELLTAPDCELLYDPDEFTEEDDPVEPEVFGLTYDDLLSELALPEERNEDDP